MLVSPTRSVTPESSYVPGKLPKPTRHSISFFFPFAVRKSTALWE